MADKLDLKDRPRRTFQSLRVLEERGLFGGLTEIRNLTGHMTRRGVVKGFLAGFGGLTLGCDADGTKAGHTGSRDDTATSGYDSEGRDTGGRHTGGYDSEGRDTGGSDTAGDTGGADTGLAEEAPSWPVSIWLNISEDGKVTVVVVKNEMGQGIATACAMIVAEELDVDWEVVDVVLAAELDDYDLPSFSNGTWGSLSIPYNYQDWREIGGAARQMVLQAAALRWGVSTESLTTASGVVYHEEKGELPYGELAEEASALPVPTSFTLKDPSEFRIIGQPAQRVDIRDHIEGKTVYGIDVKVDGMRYAAVMQSPVFGGEVANLSELSVKGTGADQLVAIPNGVAVVASSWWVAQKALEGLDVEFLPPSEEMANLSSEQMSAKFLADLDTAGTVGADVGNVDAALLGAAVTLTREYEAPILEQAPMEPMTATAHVTKKGVDIWLSTQYADGVRSAVRSVTGHATADIRVHPMALGGGFGRKAETDYATQAAIISQAVGAPVKVIWSRAETTRHGYYRPPAAGRVTGGLNAKGEIIAWKGIAAGCSNFSASSAWNLVGFYDVPYAIDNFRAEWVGTDYGLPFGYLRQPGYNKFVFMVESFLDELAEAGGVDAGELRLRHLEGNDRAYSVMQRALELADWGNPKLGQAQGCAINQIGADAYVAHVAEVSVDESGKVKVHKVWVSIDIGVVINPDIVRAQVEGSVIYAISTGIYGEITLNRGAVEQSNFHDYKLIPLKDAPEIEVDIVASSEDPSGAGEHAVGPTIPAITNAIYRACGERVRTLPITRHGLL